MGRWTQFNSKWQLAERLYWDKVDYQPTPLPGDYVIERGDRDVAVTGRVLMMELRDAGTALESVAILILPNSSPMYSAKHWTYVDGRWAVIPPTMINEYLEDWNTVNEQA